MSTLLRTHAGLLIAGVATFIIMGAGQALYGPALPGFARQFAVPEGQFGWLSSAHWIGCFVGVGLMYLAGARIGPRHALVLMGLGSVLMALGAGWLLVLLGAVLFGLGYGMATAVFNPRILSAFGDRGPAMLSLLNATFGIGAIAAPLVFLAFRSDPVRTFWLLAGLSALVWLVAGVAGRAPKPAATALPLSFRPRWGILCFGMVSVAMEASLIGLGPAALVGRGLTEDRSAEYLSLYFVLLLVARLVLIGTAHLIRPFHLLILALTLAGLACVGAATTAYPGLCFALAGFPTGLFFPAFYVTASGLMGTDLRVPPTIVASGLVGGIAAPLALSQVTATFGQGTFFWVVAAIMLTMACAGLVLRGRVTRQTDLPAVPA